MTEKNQNRSRSIIQTSWLGIVANFVLSAFKLLVGSFLSYTMLSPV